MRAYEFLCEEMPRRPLQTLADLNKIKRTTAREESERAWRRDYLYPAMYARTDRQQELLDIKRSRLELRQLRAELERMELENERLRTESKAMAAAYGMKSRLAIDAMVEKETDRRNAGKDHIVKLAQSEMRRRRK